MDINKIKGWIISICSIVLVYGALNLVLVGGQKLWHSNDQARLDTVKNQLEILEIQISAESTELDNKKELMDSFHSSGNYYNYNSMVDTYNIELDQYKSHIDQYNSLIDEGNEISKKIGGTWYVIPIPVPRGGRSGSK